MRTQPNILFIQTDQMSASALPCYGNLIAKTPNIDRLAAEGVVFESAYCNFPLCAPSRFSMMAGQLASRIGAYDNGAEFPSSIPTLAHYLRALGYRTCLSGKMHFIGADQLHGFDERLTSDIYPGDFVWAADWDEKQHRDTNGPCAVTIAGRCERSVQIEYDEQVAERACAWIQANAANTSSPFLLTVSFTHPHDPFVCTEEYWSLYNGIEIPLPGTPPASDAHSLKMLHQYGMTGVTFTDAQILAARRGYYGAISYVDAKIGQVLTTLAALNLAETTIVILTSDHGEMLGEHGLWMKKVFFENALKVPLLVWSPARFEAARLEGLVSLVDLLPTMLGFANSDADLPEVPVENLDGIDLSDNILDGSAPPERPLMAELTCEGTPGPVFMLRRGSIKYIWSAIDPPMMFDLAADPSETINLAGKPETAELEASFVAEIVERWDAEQLARDIRLSQVRRRLIRRAHKTVGTSPYWDYVESSSPDDRWMRGDVTYNEWAFGSIEGVDS